jgi:hypothetical protein
MCRGRYSVWQWTDEFCDRHSCVSLVRGGSNYAHSPAGYYFPRPSSLATHNTWLMLSESMDRKGTFGFRCVVDAVSRPFPSWDRSIWTEIYLCHACSYHEIEDGNGPDRCRPPPARGSCAGAWRPCRQESGSTSRSRGPWTGARRRFHLVCAVHFD